MLAMSNSSKRFYAVDLLDKNSRSHVRGSGTALNSHSDEIRVSYIQAQSHTKIPCGLCDYIPFATCMYIVRP